MAGTLDGVRYFGRANRQRYTAQEWRIVNETDTYRKYVADLLDNRTGNVFRPGAYKVESVASGKSAVFFGETAWSDAERLCNDLVTARRRNGPSVEGLRRLLP